MLFLMGRNALLLKVNMWLREVIKPELTILEAVYFYVFQEFKIAMKHVR